jgi:hypothetical protein
VFKIESKGLEQAGQLLRALEKISKTRMTADLNAKERHDDARLNNAEILQFLASQGRDFVTPSTEALKDIDEAALKEIEQGLAKYKVGRSGSRIVNKGDMTEVKARGVMGSALRRAAAEWQKEITRRIEEGDFTGGGDPKLEEEYEKYKLSQYGFAYPIGKATGQLLDNVAPASRNLKLRRG